MYSTVGLILSIPLAIAAFVCAISIIPTGYVGIPVLFGKVQGGYFESGFHITNPFTNVVKIDLRTQKADETGTIPSKEMLSLTLDTSVNWRLDKEKAGDVYNTVGVKYFEKLVEPHIRSAIREVTSDYNANQFFSASRNEISNNIKATLEREIGNRGIIIESVMLKDVSAPESLRKAIELKQAQQQEAEAMQFKLEREKLEAQRKKIEAEGIQKFQEIVKQGIDKNLLAWKGIEATEALAKSQNSKIIIIGNDSTGSLPVILPAN